MSITIYNGYKTKRLYSSKELLVIQQELQQKVKDVLQNHVNVEFSKVASGVLEQLILSVFEGQLKPTDKQLPSGWGAEFLYQATLINYHSTKERKNELNHKAQIYAYPQEEETLWFFNVPKVKGLSELIQKHLDAEEYNYWTNTDPPEELKKQWPERSKMWAKVLDNYCALPSECGITLTLTKSTLMNYEPDIPTLKNTFNSKEGWPQLLNPISQRIAFALWLTETPRSIDSVLRLKEDYLKCPRAKALEDYIEQSLKEVFPQKWSVEDFASVHPVKRWVAGLYAKKEALVLKEHLIEKTLDQKVPHSNNRHAKKDSSVSSAPRV